MNERGFSIVVTGIGGLGVMWVSKVIATAASATFPYVARTESRGLSQRGGAVCSAVRFGHRVLTPATGTSDEQLILSLDALEALRVVGNLSKNGVVLTHCRYSVPAHLASSQGPANHAELSKRVDMLLEAPNFYTLDLEAIALRSGSPRLLNAVLIGAACRLMPIDFSEVLKAIAITVRPDLIANNSSAARAGYEAAKSFSSPEQFATDMIEDAA